MATNAQGLIENVKNRLGKIATGLSFELAKNNYCDIFKGSQSLAYFSVVCKLTDSEIEHLSDIIQSELKLKTWGA